MPSKTSNMRITMAAVEQWSYQMHGKDYDLCLSSFDIPILAPVSVCKIFSIGISLQVIKLTDSYCLYLLYHVQDV